MTKQRPSCPRAASRRRRPWHGQRATSHRIHASNGSGGLPTNNTTRDHATDQRAQRGVRGDRLLVHARRHRPHATTRPGIRRPGTQPRRDEERAAQGHARMTSTSTRTTWATACSAGRRSRRSYARSPRWTASCILFSSVPAAPRRRTTLATRRRTKSVTGWGCITRSRAAARSSGDGVDDTPAEKAPRSAARRAATRARAQVSRRRPDHQLHGLHRRRLHGHVHGGPGHAHGRALGDVPPGQVVRSR